ncbi:MAG: CNNM domain-containing protein [Lachnospiraceae bacterium]|nr:CNNM domain-containing protein [Lachnospiraceae bacterium]
MDSSELIQVICLIILLALSAFFSSAETAMTTVNQIRILSLAEQGDRRAKRLLKILEDKGKMLSAVLVGNNLVNISASSLMTTLIISLVGNAAVGIGTGILTLLVLIFGEITPKTLATLYAEKLSLSYAAVISFLMKILTPIIFIVNKLSMGLMLLLHIDPNAKANPMTEHELRTLVDVSHEDGVIESEERQMINNVFDFGDTKAEDIMVPRIDMTSVDIDTTYDELIEIFKTTRFTRLPVYEDTTDSVIGILNIKELLLIDSKEDFDIHKIMREPFFTFEHKNIASLLDEMREKSKNFAIVIDEYGATAGLITLEDILEEIVGDIRDEYTGRDEVELVELVSGREYLLSGSMKLDDINEALGLKLNSDSYDSIGGYIIEHSEDKLPLVGEFIITEDNIRFVVQEVYKNRITKVHVYLPEKAVNDAKDAED